MNEKKENLPNNETPILAIKPFRPIDNNPDTEATEALGVMDKFEDLFEQSEEIILITDLDGTIVPYRENPQECVINPVAKNALIKLQNSGVKIYIETGRSGVDAAAILGIPGAVIKGTAGWESYYTDIEDPAKGQSIVHEDLANHKVEINDLLDKLKTKFLATVEEQLPISESATSSIIDIASASGLIIIERKAINADFENGVALNFNFNQTDPQLWDKIEIEFRDWFNEGIANHPELKDLYKLSILRRQQASFQAFSISITPGGEEGKDKSLLQIIRDERNISGDNIRQRGVIFLGDTVQDAKAARATHLTAVLAGIRSASIAVKRTNIDGQEQLLKTADVYVDDIDGAAQLLERLASIAERKQAEQNKTNK